jgi:hypothetical protein
VDDIVYFAGPFPRPDQPDRIVLRIAAKNDIGISYVIGKNMSNEGGRRPQDGHHAQAGGKETMDRLGEHRAHGSGVVQGGRVACATLELIPLISD